MKLVLNEGDVQLELKKEFCEEFGIDKDNCEAPSPQERANMDFIVGVEKWIKENKNPGVDGVKLVIVEADDSKDFYLNTHSEWTANEFIEYTEFE